jgi:hypothetical protein
VEIVNAKCYDNGRAQLRVEGQGRVNALHSEFDKNAKEVPWLELRGGRAIVDGLDYAMQAP